ncbi:MAG: calcium-binding protein, partial [Alphaproteobacteria bacterium]|nr:calcium-binding protein [Alphaproteobacteria bacterium]
DFLLGVVGFYYLKGGYFSVCLYVGWWTYKLDGGEGDDVLLGGEGGDKLKGGDGRDQLDGGTGADKLDGGEGDDVLLGGEGDDTLKGGDGDDTLEGGAGTDKIDGGQGYDTVVFDGKASDYLVKEGRQGIEFHDLREGGSVDTVKNAEVYEFADQTLSVEDVAQAMVTGWSDTFGGSGGDTSGDVGGDTLSGEADIGNASFSSRMSSRWGNSPQLQNAETMSTGDGWTLGVNSGTEQPSDGDGGTLGDNAAGSITLEDNNQIAFQNADNIDYSGS